MNKMISVSEALNIIKEKARLLSPVYLSIHNAAGLVLAEDVCAQTSIPSFRQSAMDGYAFRFDDMLEKKELLIKGEAAAGDVFTSSFEPHCAIRIFTGAAVPAFADTVVMQEKTEVNGEQLTILDNSLIKGSNIRLEGSEIRKGELALPAGTQLTPAAIGFLAGTGVTEVKVYPQPAVHIIITGKELQQPGQELAQGKVYESNSVMLKAALQQLQITNVTVSFAGDDLQETTNAINTALKSADLILLTGGVSVGDFDFVVEAAELAGVKKLFHKIKQRPGKPLYAGMKDGKILFGLPGNPASVLTCFYVYVTTAIEQLTGRKKIIQKRQLPLKAAYQKKVALTQFLKGRYLDDEVEPLAAQESFRLSSFSLSNCLILLPEDAMDFAKGQPVETLILPYL